MRHLRIFNTTRHSVLGTRIRVAETWWSRLRGFLGRPEPRPGEGIMLVPCRGVHMLGMKYALDVIFLDHAGAVVRTYPSLRPGRRTSYHREAEYVIEVPVGTIKATGTIPGDQVVWLPVASNTVTPRDLKDYPRKSANGKGALRNWPRAPTGSGSEEVHNDA